MAAKRTARQGKGQSEKIRRMVVAAMLSAITAVMVFTPLGMIPLPPPLLAVTMAHIPVILASLVETASVGLTVGLVFGVCSCIRAWQSGAVGLTLFFRNPLISVLPRMLVPLMVWLVYQLWQKRAPKGGIMGKVGVAVAAVSGAVTNTVACLGILLLLYGKELGELVQGIVGAGELAPMSAAGWLVTAVGLPNGIAEAVVAAVLAPVLKTAVEAVQRRSGRKMSA